MRGWKPPENISRESPARQEIFSDAGKIFSDARDVLGDFPRILRPVNTVVTQIPPGSEASENTDVDDVSGHVTPK